MMTKDSFLKELLEKLRDHGLREQDIQDIHEEYSSMIDDALEHGEDLESFVKRMGSAKKIAKAIRKNYPEKSSKVVQLMPFLATAVFFLLGVLADAWHPGWLVFLLIPVSSILSERRIEWAGLSVFAILTIFILMGTYFDLWNPFWALFLLVTTFGKEHASKAFIRISRMYTWLSVIAYHILVLAISFEWFGTSIQSPQIWLAFAPLMFVPIAIFALLNGSIKLTVDLDKEGIPWSKVIEFLILVGSVVALYLILGFYVQAWHPGWLVFFLIPSYYTIKSSKRRVPFTSLMPFIATSLFVLVGEYISLPNASNSYAVSWLFFLLIPVSGILFNKQGE